MTLLTIGPESTQASSKTLQGQLRRMQVPGKRASAKVQQGIAGAAKQ